MKLGARILKTGIAIVLALLLAHLIGFPSPVFAGIAAIFAIKPTIYRSYLSIIEQVQGNIIGAVIAVIFVSIFSNNVLVIGLAAILIILIMLKLKLEQSITLTLVTLIVIMEAPNDQFYQTAFVRFSTLLLGILSSFVVNMIFLPPKYETRLFQAISNVSDELFKFVRLASTHTTDAAIFKQDVANTEERIKKVDDLLSMYKEERSYFQQNKIDKKRKVVIYRQLVTVLHSCFDILQVQQKFEYDLRDVAPDIQERLQIQLDSLLKRNELLLLKLLGKLREDCDTILEEDNTDQQRDDLMIAFVNKINETDYKFEARSYHLMHLLSSMVEYQDQLIHLELLIDSFRTYHKDTNEITIPETNNEDL